MTRVALIDDHESVRLVLIAVCGRAGTLQVVFDGATVDEYLAWRSSAADEARSRLGVRPQTLYAYVSRGRVQVRPDPHDPRRTTATPRSGHGCRRSATHPA